MTLPVSVLIPAYNSENYIRRCIDSVLNQTVLPMEVIVTDDGSTDNTAAIANSYGGIVRVISKGKNCGLPAARNFGVQSAKGEWVAFLDSDDEWEPEKNEMAIATIELHKTNWCMVARKEVHEQHFIGKIDPGPGEMICINYFSLVLHGKGCAPSSTMVHKSIFDKTGGFNEILTTGEDQEMWWRIASVNPKIGYYSKPLVRYYVGDPASMSNSRKNESKLLAFWDAATRVPGPENDPENYGLFLKVRNRLASKSVRSYLRVGNYQAADYIKNSPEISCSPLAKLLLMLPKAFSTAMLVFAYRIKVGRIMRHLSPNKNLPKNS